MAAFKLFEAQVIPALLFNSESWIGLTNTHISDLQNFQDKFVRKLLRLPPSTPKATLGLRHETDEVENSRKEAAIRQEDHDGGQKHSK